MPVRGAVGRWIALPAESRKQSATSSTPPTNAGDDPTTRSNRSRTWHRPLPARSGGRKAARFVCLGGLLARSASGGLHGEHDRFSVSLCPKDRTYEDPLCPFRHTHPLQCHSPSPARAAKPPFAHFDPAVLDEHLQYCHALDLRGDLERRDRLEDVHLESGAPWPRSRTHRFAANSHRRLDAHSAR